jgi:hypothetical protein
VINHSLISSGYDAHKTPENGVICAKDVHLDLRRIYGLDVSETPVIVVLVYIYIYTHMSFPRVFPFFEGRVSCRPRFGNFQTFPCLLHEMGKCLEVSETGTVGNTTLQKWKHRGIR